MSWLDMWDEGPHTIVNNKSKGPSEVELDKWKREVYDSCQVDKNDKCY